MGGPPAPVAATSSPSSKGPERDLGWHRADDGRHRHVNDEDEDEDELRAIGAFLDGRVMHELMADFWPTAEQDPSSTPPMVEFARIWRDMPRIVAGEQR